MGRTYSDFLMHENMNNTPSGYDYHKEASWRTGEK